jgi:hypothetical protein
MAGRMNLSQMSLSESFVLSKLRLVKVGEAQASIFDHFVVVSFR